MEKFDSLFEKFKGAYILFLIIVITLVGSIVAMIFYLPFNPSYNMFTNYVSDLGAGPIGAKLGQGIGNIGAGILMLPLTIFLFREFQKSQVNSKIILINAIMGFIGSLSLILIGFFPLDPAMSLEYEVHRVIAIVFFSSEAIVFFLIGLIEFKNTTFSKTLAIISFITAIFCGAFSIGFYIQEYTPIQRNALVYGTEWISYLFIIVWLFGHGLFYLKKK